MDLNLDEILAGGFQGCRIGVTALLESAPVERVRVNWPACAAELDFMRCWRTPRHIEEFLRKASSVVCLSGNRLRAMILWGNGRPPLEADTCILRAVHVHRPALTSELEAAGFAVSEVEATRPQGSDLAAAAWPIALQILEDDKSRPPLGYGRLIALARLVNAKLGSRYKDESVRKAIGPSLRDWEHKHPCK
jgi:hypothetical protein